MPLLKEKSSGDGGRRWRQDLAALAMSGRSLVLRPERGALPAAVQGTSRARIEPLTPAVLFLLSFKVMLNSGITDTVHQTEASGSQAKPPCRVHGVA